MRSPGGGAAHGLPPPGPGHFVGEDPLGGVAPIDGSTLTRNERDPTNRHLRPTSRAGGHGAGCTAPSNRSSLAPGSPIPGMPPGPLGIGPLFVTNGRPLSPTEVVVMCYIPDLGQRAFALLAGPFVMHYNPPGNSLSTSGKLTNPSIQGKEPRREPGGVT